MLLDHAALVLSLLILGKAGLDDWIHREVQDKVWFTYLLGALPYWILRMLLILLSPTITDKMFLILLMFINIILSIVTALGLGLLGMWGGGDVKGFIVMGFGVTTLPLLLFDPTSTIYVLNRLIPPAFTILSNAYFILLPLPVLIFIRNMYLYMKDSSQYVFPSQTSSLRKVVLLFLARPYRLEELEQFHYWHYDLMELPSSIIQWIKDHETEFYEEDSSRRQELKTELEELISNTPSEWRTSLRVGLIEPEFDSLIKKKVLERAREEKRKIIWAQRSIPFVTFMFFGLILAALVGNALIYLLLLM